MGQWTKARIQMCGRFVAERNWDAHAPQLVTPLIALGGAWYLEKKYQDALPLFVRGPNPRLQAVCEALNFTRRRQSSR